MLCVTSPFEAPLSRNQQRRVWELFLKGNSTHSVQAQTLPYIMRRCEQEQIPYTLRASPGIGYTITRWCDDGNS